MNALINAISNQKKIMIANEARLLKKSFFGLLILALAFQGGEFGDIVRNSITDAYVQVSVFVGFTLFVFIGLDSLTNFDIKLFLSKTQKIHVSLAAFLGAIPGCGGAIIVVTQYIQGRISFGSLVAVLTATMGDAAFLILAIEPSTGLLIFSLGIIVGSISGYTVDIFHGIQFMLPKSKINIEYDIINGVEFIYGFILVQVISHSRYNFYSNYLDQNCIQVNIYRLRHIYFCALLHYFFHIKYLHSTMFQMSPQLFHLHFQYLSQYFSILVLAKLQFQFYIFHNHQLNNHILQDFG